MTIHHDRFMVLVTAPQGNRAFIEAALEIPNPRRQRHSNRERMVEIRGMAYGLRKLCQAFDKNFTTIAKRIDRGVGAEAALVAPVRRYGRQP